MDSYGLMTFLKKYSYKSIGTATPTSLMSYISQLEILAGPDPVAKRIISGLRSTPINQIPAKIATLENYLKSL